MKDLEDALIPIAGPLMAGEYRGLSVLDQWTIARWTIMKAMVWEHVTREHALFYTDEERFMIRDGYIPPNTVVWLAAHTGLETFYAHGNRADSLPGVLPNIEAYFTTMAYQRLVMQVLSVRPHDLTDPYTHLSCRQSQWADAIVRIWPALEQRTWPPLVLLGANMLEKLQKRCSA